MPSWSSTCIQADEDIPASKATAAMTFAQGDELHPQASSSKGSSPRQNIDLNFLDYLAEDFFCLSRFEVAINQMIRIVRSSDILSNSQMQEKIVRNIETAKETLTEEGASVNPFVKCPAHLECYREKYLDLLAAVKSLVPYINDPDVKLRLRRLILPLTSGTRFRFSPASDATSAKSLSPPPPLNLAADETIARQQGLVSRSEKNAKRGIGPGAPPDRALKRGKLESRHAENTHACTARTSSMVTPEVGRENSPSRIPRSMESGPIRRPAHASISNSDPTSASDFASLKGKRREPSKAKYNSKSPSPGLSVSTEFYSSERDISSDEEDMEGPFPLPNLPPVSYVSSKSLSADELLRRRKESLSSVTPESFRRIPPPLSISDSASSPVPSLSTEDSSPDSSTSSDASEPKDDILPTATVNANTSRNTSTVTGAGYHGVSSQDLDSADQNFRLGLGWFPSNPSHGPQDWADTKSGLKSGLFTTPGLPPGMVWGRSVLDAPTTEDLRAMGIELPNSVDLARLGQYTEDEMRAAGIRSVHGPCATNVGGWGTGMEVDDGLL